MAISSSLVAKVGTAGAITAGGGGLVGTYFAWDHINYYEVERKVMNEQVALKVGDTNGNTPWTISIDTTAGTNDTKVWKEDVSGGGYYWKCEISGPSELSITKADLEGLLPIAKEEKDTTKLNNKKKLVYECSKKRNSPTHNKVAGSFTFPNDTKANNWKTVLFGPQPTTTTGGAAAAA